ncbi:MAG: radical SAM protein [Gammaproteobacteria bacterium]|nr:radical SAM protein [Gammaproteobacteria bacterium]
MGAWADILGQVEPLEDLAFDERLLAQLEGRRDPLPAIHFYTPTFKNYASSEIKGCGRNAWPAVSITGGDCKLNCDHCKAKILEPMIAAKTPEDLWRVVNEVIANGAGGMLLTGGSNHRNEVEYDPYYETIRRIKDEFPLFRIAMHTALVDDAIAGRMADAGIDAAMMDVIGSQDTITQVYHLKRTPEDFERALEALTKTSMKVVPHIVVGLHYGQLLGEWRALEMVARHQPAALVLVVVMPTYANELRPFVAPDAHEVGQFFLDARQALPELPLLLGCARPAGEVKRVIDAYAVMAGVNGMAHPSDGMVELAARLDRPVRVTASCCSIAVGDEVMALDGADEGFEIDLARILDEERARRAVRSGPLGRIRVVSDSGSGCCSA